MRELISLTSIRDNDGGFIVYFNEQTLDKRPSLKVINHSPDGFSYGYLGSGCAQLALAILMKVTSVEEAKRFYQDFKAEFVATWKNPGTYQVDVEKWLAAKRGEHENS